MNTKERTKVFALLDEIRALVGLDERRQATKSHAGRDTTIARAALTKKREAARGARIESRRAKLKAELAALDGEEDALTSPNGRG